MPQVGFEPAIPARERPQTHALDRSPTAIGKGVDLIDLHLGLGPLSPDAPRSWIERALCAPKRKLGSINAERHDDHREFV